MKAMLGYPSYDLTGTTKDPMSTSRVGTLTCSMGSDKVCNRNPMDSQVVGSHTHTHLLVVASLSAQPSWLSKDRIALLYKV